MSDQWSVLTEAELIRLCDLAMRWRSAHETRNYALSDQLRQELIEWGAWPPEFGWHPIFEMPAHRYDRIRLRGVC